ncbi:phage tail tip lysozyme [Leuconostoc suionicum]|uniref:phage tail tip lysozyme n=2 Tax=Leuconostoc suionicum TaxID=1511761 RepID=UPI00300C1925
MLQIVKQLNKKFILIILIFTLIIITAYQSNTPPKKSENFNVEKSEANRSNSKKNKYGKIGNTKYIKKVYFYLHNNYGLSAQAIAGILGNWVQESGIDPIAVQGDWKYRSLKNSKENTNNHQKDIGVAQWSSKRRAQLISYANEKYNGEWWNMTCQLEFMTQYDGSFVEILKEYSLNAGDNIVQNAVDFNEKWEVSADDENKIARTRGSYAENVYKYMKDNNMTGEIEIDKLNNLRFIGGSIAY